MSDSPSKPAPFEVLGMSDLVVVAVYASGTAGTTADGSIGKILPVGNQGGFRYSGSIQKRMVRVAVLYTSGTAPDWPDELDVQTGRFTYYGDKKKPGHELHKTSRRGNQLLRDVFEAAHGATHDRAGAPPSSSRSKRYEAAVCGFAASSLRAVRASPPTRTWPLSGAAHAD